MIIIRSCDCNLIWIVAVNNEWIDEYNWKLCLVSYRYTKQSRETRYEQMGGRRNEKMWIEWIKKANTDIGLKSLFNDLLVLCALNKQLNTLRESDVFVQFTKKQIDIK